jgi:hypothetical protein
MAYSKFKKLEQLSKELGKTLPFCLTLLKKK